MVSLRRYATLSLLRAASLLRWLVAVFLAVFAGMTRLTLVACVQVGTFQAALVASSLNKPFYVAAESFKFSRIFPLNQSDIPRREGQPEMDNDYTPPNHITLLFTDVGVLTPSAVSDELIRLYQ